MSTVNQVKELPPELIEKEPKRKLKVKKKRISRSWWGDLLIILMLACVGLFMVMPLVYVVVQAFKPLNELFIFPPRFYVVNPTLDNFKQLSELTQTLWVPFSRYLFNTVFVSVTVTVSHVILASMAAYPLEKHKFPGSKGIFSMVQLALLFTGGTMAIPLYIVMAKLGTINTYWSVILPPIASSLGLFLMKQFMNGVPDTMLEAAKIDGAKELLIFWRIVMPNVKPAWLTLSIFSFQGIWNATGANLLYAEQLKLMPTALNQIFAADATGVGNIARAGVGSAVSLIMIIPPIIFFIITQSNVLETMASSGMKD